MKKVREIGRVRQSDSQSVSQPVGQSVSQSVSQTVEMIVRRRESQREKARKREVVLCLPCTDPGSLSCHSLSLATPCILIVFVFLRMKQPCEMSLRSRVFCRVMYVLRKTFIVY